jgi:hypothetical protein
MNSKSSFPEDRVLWQDFLAGEVSAFEKLMSDNFRLLFRYGSKFSKDRELVKDSIQDLFMILWEKRDNLSSDAAVKPYLMASLRRLMHRAGVLAHVGRRGGVAGRGRLFRNRILGGGRLHPERSDQYPHAPIAETAERIATAAERSGVPQIFPGTQPGADRRSNGCVAADGF